MSKTGKKQIEPYLVSVLASRLDGINVEMTNTVYRTARSQVLSIAKDFSTALMDRNGNVISAPEGIPIHCGSLGLLTKHLFNHPDGIHEGDLFLNNSPYHGCTHPADHTFIAPVFNDGELMFFSILRAHQADCGDSLPTTYYSLAKDVYEEGALIFPCVKIQKNYEDVTDIINMAKMRIRVPKMWYGDYLSGVGTVRTGEKQLVKLCKEYGNELIKDFCDVYMDYADKRMISEIQKLSDEKVSYEFPFDAIDGVSDELTIHLEAWVDKEKNIINIDTTKNHDALDWALNLDEATAIAACRAGVMLHMEDLPRIDSAMKRINVILRENCVMGYAQHPKSYSSATTNLADRTLSGVAAMMNKLEHSRGQAETNCNLAPSQGVISGKDIRHNNEPFINQILSGGTGGPGVNGHDGWVTFMDAGVGGASRWDSNELLEQQYPIYILKQEIITDRIGSGEFDSAPSCEVNYATRGNPLSIVLSCDGGKNAPKGANGGKGGCLAKAYKYKMLKGKESAENCPMYGQSIIEPDEIFVSECSVAGGYGNPLNRNPEKVCHRVREEWITKEYAKKVYGVVIDTSNEEYKVDYEKTNELRKQMSKNI